MAYTIILLSENLQKPIFLKLVKKTFNNKNIGIRWNFQHYSRVDFVPRVLNRIFRRLQKNLFSKDIFKIFDF